jgi:alpha-N-arabinofuranosidase
VNAGSDTFPLEVAAALTPDRRSLTVAVVNATDAVQTLDLSVTGVTLTGGGRVWRMAPGGVDASVVVGQKPEVEVEDRTIDTWPAPLEVPPLSISIYVLPAR